MRGGIGGLGGPSVASDFGPPPARKNGWPTNFSVKHPVLLTVLWAANRQLQRSANNDSFGSSFGSGFVFQRVKEIISITSELSFLKNAKNSFSDFKVLPTSQGHLRTTHTVTNLLH